MATTRFNENILAAARRLKDLRSFADASEDATKRYSSALLTLYQNRAVRDFIGEKFRELGTGFGAILPEYVKTSGTLSIDGSIAKALDQWYFLEMTTLDGLTRFTRLDKDVLKVKAGLDPLLPATVAKPVFWEEGKLVYVMPAKNGANPWEVIARYVVVPQDIAVVLSSSGTGKRTASALSSFTFASKALLGYDMAPAVDASDVNQKVYFWTAGQIYTGLIERQLGNIMGLRGDGLPSGDLAAGQILGVIIPPQTDPLDLQLSAMFDSDIVGRMVAMGTQDAYQDKTS